MANPGTQTRKPKPNPRTAWRERGSCSGGTGLESAWACWSCWSTGCVGCVTPLSLKYFVDNVVGQGRPQLLLPLVTAVVVATVIQAGTTFALSNIMSVAAQRAITDMRKPSKRTCCGCRSRYFDSTKTGVAHLAHHDRRRRHPEPGRHRPRAARRAASSRRSSRSASCSS